MKIGWNAMQVRAAKSGVGQYIHALVEAVLAEDNNDDFLLFASPQNVINYQFDAPNYKAVVWGLDERKKWLRLAKEYLFFASRIRDEKIEIFHGLSNFLPLRKACRYVVTIHDLSYYRFPERCPVPRRQYWYALTARSISIADIIITDSQNSRSDIEHFFPKAKGRIVVIPLAAHARFQKVLYPREKSAVYRAGISQPYLLYVGTLEPGKNVDRIIGAFEQVASEFPDHQLILIGDKGWLYDKVLARIQNSSFHSRIHQLGHLPDADVVDFLNFCEVFVFPSIYEGFGLPPLEAMACGAAVITSNTSSLPEVVGNAAITVDPYAESEIAGAIRRVLSDQTLRSELSSLALDRTQNFSWAETARRTLDVYHSLLS